MNAQLTLALILLASIALNVGLVLWLVAKGKGPERLLAVWTGRGFEPVKLKKGVKQHEYKRADKSKAIFNLDEEWAMPWGKRGLIWVVNAMNGGSVMKWATDQRVWVPVVPDGHDGSLATGAWRELGKDEEPPEVEGSVFSIEWLTRKMEPSADYLATVLDDIREKKWFEGHKQAESNTGNVKPNWLLIAAAAAAVWFFFLKGG